MAQARGGGDLQVLQRHQVEVSDNFARQLEAYTPQLMQALPPSVPIDRFKRVLITAVAQNPDLLYVDRRSLFMSAAKCAIDGLLPDGRQAVLLPFHTDVKLRDPATGLDRKIRMELAQYIPMVHGIRDRMRRTGEVLKAEAEVVYRNDKFRYRKGDDGFIEHEPVGLGEDPGELIGAYAIITLRNGEKIREVMNKAAIDKVRTNSSKQPNGPLWRDHYEEAARKTVLRLASKQAPQSADDREAMERLLARDDEPPEPPEHGAIEHEPEAPPPPRQVSPPVAVEDDVPQFAVVDLDGVETLYSNGGRAYAALRDLLNEAARYDIARVEGWWESNQATIEQIVRDDRVAQVAPLIEEYDQLRERMTEADEHLLSVRDEPTSSGNPEPEPERAVDEPVDWRQGPRGVQGPEPHPEDAFPRDAEPAAPPRPPPAAEARPPVPRPAPVAEARPAAPPAAAATPAPGTRKSYLIPPVDDRGKKNWDSWIRALFIPRMRRMTDGVELAWFLGDNAEHLEQARAASDAPQNRLIDEAIAQQNAKVR